MGAYANYDSFLGINIVDEPKGAKDWATDTNGEFADDYKNVRWYSNQPEMEFTVYEPYTSGTGFIMVNEQKIEIRY